MNILDVNSASLISEKSGARGIERHHGTVTGDDMASNLLFCPQ